MMRAIIALQPGDPGVLTMINVPIPTPGPTELLVKVHFAALNRADLLQRRGKYLPPAGESAILGLEIAGEVIAMGEQVQQIALGTRVFGLVASGAYAEYCLIDYRLAMQIPAELSDQEATSIPEAFLTAQEALFTLGQLKKHETVLIHAGGSGVGTAAIQLAKQVNATVVTTVRTVEKIPTLKTLGADHIINTHENTELTHVPQVDVILDVIGARLFNTHLKLLKPQGRLICIGLMGGAQSQIDLSLLLGNRLHIHGLIMRTQSLPEKCRMVEHFKNNWLPLFKNHKLMPVIDRQFDFIDVAKAHDYMERNQNIGKILLKII